MPLRVVMRREGRGGDVASQEARLKHTASSSSGSVGMSFNLQFANDCKRSLIAFKLH
jgi:hypothetical protein